MSFRKNYFPPNIKRVMFKTTVIIIIIIIIIITIIIIIIISGVK
jgi:hypothetical protein